MTLISVKKETLNLQKQWSQKVKEADDFDVPKVDLDNKVKTMKYIILHLKLMRGIRRTLLDYMVWHYVKVAHILT